jgi:methanethiol S-methyltransferase
MPWHTMTSELLLLGLLWLAYFVIHSVAASLWLKSHIARRWPELMPGYRIAFNAAATLLLLPPLMLMWSLAGEPLWRYEGAGDWLRFALMGLAAGGFLWSLGYYDGMEFLGLRQLRENLHEIEDQERLHISPLHRFVRHPWYSLGLVLVWTQEMDEARLLSSLLITAYLLVGSRLEENKLRAYHGERYQRYRERVPGLIPFPGRYLSRSQAARLLEEE